MKKNWLNGLILLLVLLTVFCLLFAVSCRDPDDDDDTEPEPPEPEPPEPDPDLMPPSDVTVFRIGSQLRITWSCVEEAEQYRIFRKEGAGNYVLMTGITVIEEHWDDTSFPLDKTLVYKVQSMRGNGISELSDPSNPVSILVQNVKATIFEHTDMIKLTWDVHPEGPDYYIIYRYIAGENPVLDPNFGNVTVTTNEYNDAVTKPNGPPLSKTRYFYKVTWVKDLGIGQEELGKEQASLIFGIFSEDEKDVNEPNEDYQSAKLLQSGGEEIDAVIYSYGDGAGGVLKDIDCYSYHGQPQVVQVTVNVTSTEFAVGEVKFQFCYKGVSGAENDVKANNLFTFDIPDEPGDVDLYFRLYPVVPSTADKFATYTIKIIE